VESLHANSDRRPAVQTTRDDFADALRQQPHHLTGTLHTATAARCQAASSDPVISASDSDDEQQRRRRRRPEGNRLRRLPEQSTLQNNKVVK